MAQQQDQDPAWVSIDPDEYPPHIRHHLAVAREEYNSSSASPSGGRTLRPASVCGMRLTTRAI